MQKLFSSKTYSNRRKKLSDKFQGGLLLFLSNSESPMNYRDNTYRYRQDSNFLYFFGLSMTNVVGVIDAESGQSILFGDDPSMDDIVWTGPVEKMESLGLKIGIEKVQTKSALADFIKDRKVHFLPQYRHDNMIMLSNMLGKSIDEILGQHSEELVNGVIALRSYKSSEEIAQMEEALITTKVMHEKVMKSVKPGMTESALTGIARGIAVGSAADLAYPIILSKDGQTLHNHHHHNKLEDGQLVLADMGAQNDMFYAADITRTFPVSGRFSEKQKEIYRIVLDAEESSIQMCAAGVPYADVHRHACLVIARGLTHLGLMKGDPEEAVKAGAHALFFPHGLGHMIGLDVHDMEDLGEDLVGYDTETKRSDQFGTAYLRLGRKLEAGFVITVEPGIYFIPELIDQWKETGQHSEFINFEKLSEYRDFGGIRIEDNILITENGYRILGPAIAKGIDEIEALHH